MLSCYHADMNYLATFLEGVATFVSPCLLPLLPLYLAYFAGGSSASLAQPDAPTGKARLLSRVTGFIVGFAIVFVALGALSGAIGAFLARYSLVISVVCGMIIIVFGLHYAGVMHIPLLEKTVGPQAGVQPVGFASSVLFGVVFAVGWTPCVGVFLGTALALAATEGSAMQGALLLACYSAGLAVPFVICAFAIDKLMGAIDAIKRHYELVRKVCGVLLVIMGIVVAIGPLITHAESGGSESRGASQAARESTWNNAALSSLTVMDSNGYDVSFSALEDGRPIVVNLWATWCPYCVDEMGDFEQLYENYGNEVQFVMLNAANPAGETGDAVAYLAENGFTFPVYYDTYDEVKSSFNVAAYPTTIVIARDGEVLSNRPGRIDPTRFDAALASLI